ncbi:hypothetical protein OESDEN_14318 [Oesophagostomum dentatum]|uniref:Uncharacterized protein n=1 Tax=Oesophagostomum dentatum TaxID=61180 RepID=A0A0B1SRU2_OESDE|nr:hypothetical protein OESDEN_14318 [Oesophagostomum dentatum]
MCRCIYAWNNGENHRSRNRMSPSNESTASSGGSAGG